MPNDSTAVAVREPFAVAQTPKAELDELFRLNLGNAGLRLNDLPQIKVPTGGQQVWMVPSLEGDAYLKELEGVIVLWRNTRAYYATAFDKRVGTEKAFPDCSSADGVIGYAKNDPQPARCEDCAHGQYGGDCREKRWLFFLRKDDILPLWISVPRTSIPELRQFFTRLSGKRLSHVDVIVRLTLEKAESKQHISYCKVKPIFVAALENEERAAMHSYRDMLDGLLSSRAPAAATIDTTGNVDIEA